MRERLLHLAQIVAEAVQFAQSLLNTQSFIQWQRLNTEPRTPLHAKKIGGGTPLDQVCNQDCVNLVLQPCTLPHQL
ncbi:hypothetical protein WL99_22155 [Burkholderia cepacia]|nr:hypothetical protein WL99_22155 [Burkholderia cepacia]